MLATAKWMSCYKHALNVLPACSVKGQVLAAAKYQQRWRSGVSVTVKMEELLSSAPQNGGGECVSPGLQQLRGIRPNQRDICCPSDEGHLTSTCEVRLWNWCLSRRLPVLNAKDGYPTCAGPSPPHPRCGVARLMKCLGCSPAMRPISGLYRNPGSQEHPEDLQMHWSLSIQASSQVSGMQPDLPMV